MSKLSKIALFSIVAALCAMSEQSVQGQASVDSSSALSVDPSAGASVSQPTLPGYVDLSNLGGGPSGGGGRNRQQAIKAPPNTSSSSTFTTVPKRAVKGAQAVRRGTAVPSTRIWKPVPYAPTPDSMSFHSQAVPRVPDSLGIAGSYGNGSFGPDEGSAGYTDPVTSSPAAPSAASHRASRAVSVPSGSGSSDQGSSRNGRPSTRSGTGRGAPSFSSGSSSTGRGSPSSSSGSSPAGQ